MKTVAVLAFDRVVGFDLALAVETFNLAKLENGSKAYHVIVCSEKKNSREKHFTIGAPFSLKDALKADTIIVPGIREPILPTSKEILVTLRKAYKKGIRIASICTGAFILAESGLLDGFQATSHWSFCKALKNRHPKVEVDPNVLYIDCGQILTSAGAASGLDLCLSMVRKDYGAVVAAKTARMIVAPLERPGGQSQYVEHEIPSAEGTLGDVITWMEQNFKKPLTIPVLAKYAGMSKRSLLRKFQAQFGMSPMQFLISVRIRKAQELLETKPLTIEEVAERVGFGSGISLREHFKKRVGVLPKEYRTTFSSKRV